MTMKKYLLFQRKRKNPSLRESQVLSGRGWWKGRDTHRSQQRKDKDDEGERGHRLWKPCHPSEGQFDDEKGPSDPGNCINSSVFTSNTSVMDRVKKALFGKKSVTRRIARAIRKRRKDDPSIKQGFDNPNYKHLGKGRTRRKTKSVVRKRRKRNK